MIKKLLKFMIQNYLFLFISIIFLGSYWYSIRNLSARAQRFPFVIMTIAVVLIVYNLGACIWEFSKLYKKEKDNEQAWVCNLGVNSDILICIGITFAYVIVMKYIGYAVSTFLYGCAMLYKLKVRNIAVIVIYSLVLTLVVYGIFGVWLRIYFPRGFLNLI